MCKHPGIRQIGPVIFRWCYEGSDNDHIQVEWLGETIARSQLPLPSAQNPLHFWQVDPQDSTSTVNGEMHFTESTESLLVTRLEYPGGQAQNELLFSGKSPGPPPPDREAATGGLVVERPPESDLFPYLYLAQWPDITAADLADRFVQYGDDPSSPGSLYQALVEARTQGRSAMVAQADTFLSEEPPYTGCYLRSISTLGAPMDQLWEISAQFRHSPPESLAEFQERMAQSLGMSWREISAYWRSDTCAETCERCWQNLFALCVQPGFNRDLADQLLETLTLATLTARILASEPEPPESGEENVPPPPLPLAPPWTADRLASGIYATVILPGSIFPLPPAEQHRLNTGAAAAPTPYAIGDSKLVRQRLRGYELGEVSGIESVMRGEYKETSEKHSREAHVEEVQSGSASMQTARELTGMREDLLSEAVNSLKENSQYHYESQYGPPANQLTVIVDETVQPVGDSPQKTVNNDATRAVRLLTQRAANSLARRLHWRRSHLNISRDEHCTLRRIDASGQTGNLRAIYRWVNKRYQCWTVSLGQRFIFEFFVPDPAQAYIASTFSLRGLSLREPPPLIDFGVKTYQDISTDPESPAYYAKLAAAYAIVDFQPPPEPVSVSSATFQGGEPVCWQPVTIAPGYRAVSASVAVTPAPGASDLQLSVSVGQQRCDYPGNQGAGDPVELKLDGQTDQVPVSVLMASGTKSPPPDSGYSVAVQITAQLGEPLLNQWKLATFKAISSGCAQQRERYYETLGTWPGQASRPSSLNTRDQVRDALRRNIVRQLFSYLGAATGEAADIALGQPRYAQFFERALAWNEMAYAFTVRTEDDLGTALSQQYRGEDELFSAFLQAGLARVLLPVTPEFAHRFLYFLASGQIWPGEDSLAPTFFPDGEQGPDHHYINLVNALKESSGTTPGDGHTESWELVVPTEMTVLQEGSELPVFSGAPS